MHLFVIPSWINQTVFMTTAVLAIWYGGWRERAIGTAILAMYPFGIALCSLTARLCPGKLARSLVIDGVVAVTCLLCLRRADRYWVVWATACAFLEILADLTRLIPGVSLWTWASAGLGAFYILCGAVLWGVWCSVRSRETASLRPLLR